MIELWRQMPTAVQACERFRSGALAPAVLWEQCRSRARVFEEQLQALTQLSRESLVPDESRGLLFGLPIGIKDIIDVAGWPTRAGFPLSDPAPAKADAPIVAALRQHGAIPIAKTVTCQFAAFDPAPTLNPWDRTRTPGGSSAGSAVAVAVGECLAAIGTQTGGSILRPASYCGICGFKPAHDARWLAGVVPVSARLDHVGPLARTVNDLLLVWRAIRGEEAAALSRRLRQPPTLGVLRDYFFERATPEMQRLTQSALDRWAAAGARVIDVPLPPGFSEVHHSHRVIMAHDAAEYHRARFTAHPESYLPQLTGLIQEGLAISDALYAQAVEFQYLFQQHLLRAYPDVDILVTPSATSTAPPRDTTGDPSFHSPWSLAGVPTVCFPTGLANDGLPGGVQMIAPHRLDAAAEFSLLAIAAWCEECLGLDMSALLASRLEQQFPEARWIDPP